MTLKELVDELSGIETDADGDLPVKLYYDGAVVVGEMKVTLVKGCQCCGRPYVQVEVS